MARYVEIDSAVFEKFLADQGFTRTVSNFEVVYVKPFLPEPHVTIKVYTSIRIGDAVARDVGKDAIRVVAVFDNGKKTFGLFKGARVYRTTSQESVQARTQERIVTAIARCQQWSENQRAGRPTFIAGEPKDIKAPTLGEHFGAVGQKVRITVRVNTKKQYNESYLFTMQDEAGHVFIYWSKRAVLQVGEMYDMSCTIKKHGSFAGNKQTELTNCAGKRVVM